MKNIFLKSIFSNNLASFVVMFATFYALVEVVIAEVNSKPYGISLSKWSELTSTLIFLGLLLYSLYLGKKGIKNNERWKPLAYLGVGGSLLLLVVMLPSMLARAISFLVSIF